MDELTTYEIRNLWEKHEEDGTLWVKKDIVKAQELLLDNQRIRITILELRLKKLESNKII